MENREFNINEIVKIETLPQIFEQLELLGKYVDEQLEGIDTLECNETNKTMVKNKRTEINNTLKVLEEKRKEIKSKILQPYEMFNSKYEETTKNKLENASQMLGRKINEIEIRQKEEKENELREFYQEYIKKYNLETMNIPFERVGLNITLSNSMKSLKGEIVVFTETISNDLKLIDLEEYKDEIMIEYKQTLDFANSKMNVVTRHRLMEEERKRREALAEQLKQEQQIVETVEEVLEEEIIAPVDVDVTTDDVEEEFTLTFTVQGTKQQLLKLKQFLNEEGLKYE